MDVMWFGRPCEMRDGIACLLIIHQSKRLADVMWFSRPFEMLEVTLCSFPLEYQEVSKGFPP